LEKEELVYQLIERVEILEVLFFTNQTKISKETIEESKEKIRNEEGQIE
jgi:hypothetical protein